MSESGVVCLVSAAKEIIVSISSEIWKYRDALIQSFHVATIHGILNTWQRCDRLGTTPQEPDFVAGLVMEATPLVQSVLTSLLAPNGISVSMSAVFCHQTPRVSFDAPRVSCELGDLLFAYVHTTKSGRSRRNAILFLAKASARQPYRISGSDATQLRLYMDWSEFEYTNSSFLNGCRRSVTPKSPHAGAQYLLIDDRPLHEPMSGLVGLPGTYPVGCCMPDVDLQDHTHLASELFNLLIFRTGRAFDDKQTAAKSNDWSQVVWDVLESGVKKAFNRKNSGRSSAPRAVGDSLAMLDGTAFAMMSSDQSTRTVAEILGRPAARYFYGSNEGEPPRDRDRQVAGDGPGSGVSLVLIETSETESED
jgi:hypothetical protein